MSKKFRLSKLELTSDATNRSGLRTTNMTSATADHVVGTTFKNVQVDENGEFVVGTLSTGYPVIYVHGDIILTSLDVNKTFVIEDTDALGGDNIANVTLPLASSVKNGDIIILKTSNEWGSGQEVDIWLSGSDLIDKYYSGPMAMITHEETGNHSAIVFVSDGVDNRDMISSLDKIPSPTSYISNVIDTNTVNLTKNLNQLTADVIVDPATGNSLVANPNGLFVLPQNKVLYKSSNYTISNSDKGYIICFDTTNDQLTATLPSGWSNGEYVYIKISTGKNDLNIITSGSDTLNNIGSLLLENTSTGKTSVKLVYDGISSWLAVSDYTGYVDTPSGRIAVVSSTANITRIMDLNLNTITNISGGQPTAVIQRGDSLYTSSNLTRTIKRYTLGGSLLNTSGVFTNMQQGLAGYGSGVYACARFATGGVSVSDSNNLGYGGTAAIGGPTFLCADTTYLYAQGAITGNLTKINPVSMVAIGSISVGQGYYPTQTSDFIFVGSGGTSGNGVVTKISKSTFSVVGTCVLGIGQDPRSIAIIGSYLYVTGLTPNKIFKIDIATMSLISSFNTLSSPQRVGTDGTYLYVTSATGITKYDTSGVSIAFNSLSAPTLGCLY